MMSQETIESHVRLRSNMRIIKQLADNAKNNNNNAARIALLFEIARLAKEALEGEK